MLSLPESAGSFTLSHVRWIRSDPKGDLRQALVPDVVVRRTRATLRAGRDPVLDWLRSR